MSLGRSQTFSELLEISWTSQNFPELPWKPPGDFTRSSPTGIQQQSRGSPEVFQTSPEASRRQPVSLGSLVPSPDSRNLPLKNSLAGNGTNPSYIAASRGFTKEWFPKGWFWRCSPGMKTGSHVPPKRKLERGYVRMFPRNENRNEGTFAKTTLLRNRRFASR